MKNYLITIVMLMFVGLLFSSKAQAENPYQHCVSVMEANKNYERDLQKWQQQNTTCGSFSEKFCKVTGGGQPMCSMVRRCQDNPVSGLTCITEKECIYNSFNTTCSGPIPNSCEASKQGNEGLVAKNRPSQPGIVIRNGMIVTDCRVFQK
jgi:hypothetical protein